MSGEQTESVTHQWRADDLLDMRDGRARGIQLDFLIRGLVLPLGPNQHVDVVHLKLVHVARHEESDVRDAVAGGRHIITKG